MLDILVEDLVEKILLADARMRVGGFDGVCRRLFYSLFFWKKIMNMVGM